MRAVHGHLTLSPSDLNGFLACPHLTPARALAREVPGDPRLEPAPPGDELPHGREGAPGEALCLLVEHASGQSRG